jgi:hypothetical protein
LKDLRSRCSNSLTALLQLVGVLSTVLAAVV